MLWKASFEVLSVLEKVKSLHHDERLSEAQIGLCFDESKPFINNKINLGKVTKFNRLVRLWQNEKYDFCFVISSDLWHIILDQTQKEALLDLLLSRCEAELVPEVVEENGKKKPIKDEWGRIQYTNEKKLDDEGNPKWKISPLDLEIFAKNVRRYGVWLDDLSEIKKAIDSFSKESQNES